MEYHGVCGARQQVWDWIRSYTKPGTVYNPVKPLRECPICELPELSHILQQLLWYYMNQQLGMRLFLWTRGSHGLS